MMDTHAHLDHVEGLAEALEQAVDAGVTGIVTVGEDLASNQRNLEICRRYQRPKIYCGLGLHPGRVRIDELTACLDFIRAHHQEAVAIGEIGLDFWYKEVRKDEARKNEQRQAFSLLLEIAREFDLPVSIHSRGAWQECLAMTRASGVSRAVFHWYSGPLDVLDDLLAAGYWISATPSLAASLQAREAVRHAPINRTLLETDTPVFYRGAGGAAGFVSSPKDVLRTLDDYCELTGMAVEQARQILDENARKFFRLDEGFLDPFPGIGGDAPGGG